MLNIFRIMSMIEGISLIVLVCIAMPAKYQFGYDLVRIAGPVHGGLWLLYLPLLEWVSRQQQWPKSVWNLAFVTSVIPFGCFYLEKQFRRELLTAS